MQRVSGTIASSQRLATLSNKVSKIISFLGFKLKNLLSLNASGCRKGVHWWSRRSILENGMRQRITIALDFNSGVTGTRQKTKSLTSVNTCFRYIILHIMLVFHKYK